MRRRNHTRVDTFPFLAVLLCAMGSLILVLLVMDRRSRQAAQARGRDQVKRVVGEREKEIAARLREHNQKQEELKSAWNRKRAELKARIDAEQRALDADMLKVQARLAEIARDLREEEEAAGKLRRDVKKEQTRLSGQEQALVTANKEATELKTKISVGDRARNKLAADLVKLEQVLRDLQTARENEKTAFSVVPYTGRQGARRHPLYVECAGSQVIFHPDRQSLPDPSNAALHEEIARRLDALAQKRKKAGLPEEQGYIMMLVRPEGIRRYYQVQAAIYEMPVEFGYEFIDSDWVLSYPSDEETLRSEVEALKAEPAAPGGASGGQTIPGGVAGGTGSLPGGVPGGVLGGTGTGTGSGRPGVAGGIGFGPGGGVPGGTGSGPASGRPGVPGAVGFGPGGGSPGGVPGGSGFGTGTAGGSGYGPGGGTPGGVPGSPGPGKGDGRLGAGPGGIGFGPGGGLPGGVPGGTGLGSGVAGGTGSGTGTGIPGGVPGGRGTGTGSGHTGVAGGLGFGPGGGVPGGTGSGPGSGRPGVPGAVGFGPGGGTPGGVPGGTGFGTGSGRPGGVPGGSGFGPAGSTTGSAGGNPGNGGTGPGFGLGNGANPAAVNSGSVASGMGQTGSGLSGGTPGLGSGVNGSGTTGGSGTATGDGSAGQGQVGSRPGSAGSFPGESIIGAPGTGANATGENGPSLTGNSGNAGNAGGGTGPAAGTPGAPGSPAVYSAQAGAGAGAPARPGFTVSRGETPVASAERKPGDQAIASNGGSASGGGSDGGSAGASADSPGSMRGPTGSGPGGASSGPRMRPLGAPDFNPAQRRTARERERPLLPARVGGLGETVVYVECLSDGVVVYPGGKSISVDSLNHSPKHNPLYQAATAVLSRSKASADQQHLRFLIHRDAERTFHLAYPVFNSLGVSKTRYNLQADDDVSRIVAGD